MKTTSSFLKLAARPALDRVILKLITDYSLNCTRPIYYYFPNKFELTNKDRNFHIDRALLARPMLKLIRLLLELYLSPPNYYYFPDKFELANKHIQASEKN